VLVGDADSLRTRVRCGRLRAVIPEAQLEQTEHGLVHSGEGWFVLNAREAPWADRKGRGVYCGFEGEREFPKLGVNLQVLGPGEQMAMYHWEADQEDFLVLAGEPTLVIEGRERRLRPWDFVHCPAGTEHVIVGSGATPCVIVCIGARDGSTGPDWGRYTVDAAARRLDAGVERETSDPELAYARFQKRQPSPYRDGWLPS
jgi:uncharacterized cupin superfamily protein